VMRGSTIPLWLVMVVGAVSAQDVPAPDQVHELEERPVFKVDVIERVTVAVNYRHRSGATHIDFTGTPLMPKAKGSAKVESRQGYIEISAKFENLKPAITYGAEYLTYVLWAITPEGRAANMGELLVKKGKSRLNVTSELQVFGLVVTAEPYFAVRQPSDLVVLENEIRPDTKGKFEIIDAKYELLRRGQYEKLSNPLSLTVDPRIPLELYEARNAVEIARSTGAGEYAEETFLKAERSLRQAEAYHARNAGEKPVAMLARESVQTAEDAREIAVRRREQRELEAERREAARREAEAKAAAETEAKRRAEAEALRKNREEAAREAQEQARQEAAERARLEAELADLRRQAEEAGQEARRAMDLLKERTSGFGEERARWEQERLRREEEEARRQRRFAELEKAELRVRIYSQLGRVLSARDTEEGLSLDVPAELFARGKEELTGEGREKLAMVAGILLAHPGLSVSVASDQPALDDRAEVRGLELARSDYVRRYLIERGIVESRLWKPQAGPGEASLALAATESELAENPVTLLVFGEPIELPEQLNATQHSTDPTAN